LVQLLSQPAGAFPNTVGRARFFSQAFLSGCFCCLVSDALVTEMEVLCVFFFVHHLHVRFFLISFFLFQLHHPNLVSSNGVFFQPPQDGQPLLA